jgi:hypothetical protein
VVAGTALSDLSGSQTESQGQQDPGVVRRRQAIVIAGQRQVGPWWAASGLVRVCLLSSRPQVRVLLGAPYRHVENIFRHSVQGYVNCLRAITLYGRIILLELFLLFEQPTAESQTESQGT